MKHLSIKLLVAVIAIAISANLFAKSPSNSTLNYVEIDMTNTLNKTTVLGMDLLNLEALTLEERKINAIIVDSDDNHIAMGSIEVYSIDGLDVLGPFNITEGAILEVEIDEREWSVRTIISTQDAEVSYWF